MKEAEQTQCFAFEASYYICCWSDVRRHMSLLLACRLLLTNISTRSYNFRTKPMHLQVLVFSKDIVR